MRWGHFPHDSESIQWKLKHTHKCNLHPHTWSRSKHKLQLNNSVSITCIRSLWYLCNRCEYIVISIFHNVDPYEVGWWKAQRPPCESLIWPLPTHLRTVTPPEFFFTSCPPCRFQFLSHRMTTLSLFSFHLPLTLIVIQSLTHLHCCLLFLTLINHTTRSNSSAIFPDAQALYFRISLTRCAYKVLRCHACMLQCDRLA